MEAQRFCDRWFGIEDLPEEEREAARQRRGYRAQCIRLLAAILAKPEKTVNNWGARFENMPEDYRVTLHYADALRHQLQASQGSGFLEIFLNYFTPRE